MSLQDVSVKNEYRSLIDNVVQEFYIPLLEQAKVYKRAVGFFSSSSLVEITKGIATMASNGGKIQIVASPYLSDEDIEAIQKGYAERNSIIERAILRQITGEQVDYYSMQRLNLLACLIADGILDIRIAYTEEKNGIGMYHEKMGLIEDGEGNVVAFSGSMNESATAMSINYETIDVFRSWGEQNEADRVRLKENAFFSIWNDSEPNIKVLEFPSISQALIEKYRKSPPNFDLDKEQFPPKEKKIRTLKDGNIEIVTSAIIGYSSSPQKDWKQRYSNRIKGDNTVFDIAIKDANGNTSYVKKSQCESEVKGILPKELSRYFFFDGERIEKMSKDISTGKKATDFAEAVKGLLGLNAMYSAIQHFNPKSRLSVIGSYESSYDSHSNSKIQEYTQTIERCKAEIAKIDARLEELESQIEQASARKTEKTEEIKQYAEGEELQRQKERLIQKIARAKDSKANVIKAICKDFNSNMSSFFSAVLTESFS